MDSSLSRSTIFNDVLAKNSQARKARQVPGHLDLRGGDVGEASRFASSSRPMQSGTLRLRDKLPFNSLPKLLNENPREIASSSTSAMQGKAHKDIDKNPRRFAAGVFLLRKYQVFSEL